MSNRNKTIQGKKEQWPHKVISLEAIVFAGDSVNLLFPYLASYSCRHHLNHLYKCWKLPGPSTSSGPLNYMDSVINLFFNVNKG